MCLFLQVSSHSICSVSWSSVAEKRLSTFIIARSALFCRTCSLFLFIFDVPSYKWEQYMKTGSINETCKSWASSRSIKEHICHNSWVLCLTFFVSASIYASKLRSESTCKPRYLKQFICSISCPFRFISEALSF